MAEAVRLAGGMGAFVKKGERILLKPNLLAAKPLEKAVTTHPAVVEALIRLVREAGATPIVGDSPGLGTARKVAEKCGVAEACARTGTPLVEKTPMESPSNASRSRAKRSTWTAS